MDCGKCIYSIAYMWKSLKLYTIWMINYSFVSLSGWRCSLYFLGCLWPRCLGILSPLLQEYFMDSLPLERSKSLLDIESLIHLQFWIIFCCEYKILTYYLSCLSHAQNIWCFLTNYSQLKHNLHIKKDILFDLLQMCPCLIHWLIDILTPNMYVSAFFCVPLFLFLFLRGDAVSYARLQHQKQADEEKLAGTTDGSVPWLLPLFLLPLILLPLLSLSPSVCLRDHVIYIYARFLYIKFFGVFLLRLLWTCWAVVQ